MTSPEPIGSLFPGLSARLAFTRAARIRRHRNPKVIMTTERSSIQRVYLASRYTRASEMQGVRDVLQALGYVVTSRWIDHHGGKHLTSFTVDTLNDDPAGCAQSAIDDWDDLAVADTCISFTGQGGKGGRHVEFGMAVALGKRLIVVGPREHVLDTLPQVEHFPDWSRLAMAMA